MRLYTANIISNSEIRPGVYLIEMQAAALAQAASPGQYCMVRCCDSDATDPLLRRPFFIHTVQRERGLCTLLVQVRGRGTAWLGKQTAGATLDILGPMGHGWEIRSTVRNLLLVAEGDMLPSLILLAQTAIEQELAVTLVAQFASAQEVYPPALLPPEVEYHIVTNEGGLEERGSPLVQHSNDACALLSGAPTTLAASSFAQERRKESSSGRSAVLQGSIQDILKEYLDWADAACCAVSRPIATDLYTRFERLRTKHFAQGLQLQPLACANGACLTCSVETASGQRLVCKDGPVFGLREIAR